MQAAGELPAVARFLRHHRRAAARSGAWRHRDQRRHGAGQGRGQEAARHRRAAAAAAESQSRRGRWRGRGAGLHQPQARRRLLARAAGRVPGGGHRLWRFDDGRGRTRSMSSTSRPIRPARCTWRMRAARWWAMRSPTCSHKAGYAVTKEYYINDAGAQVDKLGQSTYLRYKEALGETIGEIPEGLYPGEYLKDVGAAIAKRDGARWIDKPEADWLPEMRGFAIATLMAEIRARPRDARRQYRRLFVGARAGRVAARSIAPSQELTRAGPDLSGPARAAQGPEARRLGGSRADPVPLDAVRRRCRPAAQEVGRQLDLLRQRHRLSPRQVRARLRRHDRHLGRRSRRLREAHEGGGERHHRQARASSTSSSASSCAC